MSAPVSGGAVMNTGSLLVVSSLIIVSLIFSYSQRLRLEKETIISILRAVVQLVAVGYLLNYIFGLKNPIFTSMLLLFMAFNASCNAAKRGKGIRHGFGISFLSICVGTVITLSVLILSKAVAYEPYQMIPVGGMIISNSMVALGLSYRHMVNSFKEKRQEVETKLALGADILPSAIGIVRESIKMGMLPTIDSAKTLGIVSLPGMMTGLILAGTDPLQAIKYQLMVTFMLLSTTSITSFLACYLAYRGFFNERKQLLK